MWVIDIRHWLNEQQDGPVAPQCWLRPKRKAVRGILKIQFAMDEQIHRFCSECTIKGINEEQGLING